MEYKVFQLKKDLAKISSHLSDMLEGGFIPLADKTNKMRFVQASHALRELLRELLSCYAPDTKIKESQWFIPDPSADSGVTRKHRTTFAVYGYVNPSVLPKTLSKEVDDIACNINKHVKRLSEFSHATAKVLAKPESEADRLIESTLALFTRLLSAIASGKEALTEELETTLTKALDKLFINDFFNELDELSTHTRPTGAYDVEVSITSIDKDRIFFSGSGSVCCDLQYGSDGDCRRGDGVEWSDCIPFNFEGWSDVVSLKIDVPKENVYIDTSEFNGDKEFEP